MFFDSSLIATTKIMVMITYPPPKNWMKLEWQYFPSSNKTQFHMNLIYFLVRNHAQNILKILNLFRFQLCCKSMRKNISCIYFLRLLSSNTITKTLSCCKPSYRWLSPLLQVTFCDLSMAFECVDGDKSVTNLKHYSFQWSILNFIKSHFNNQTNCCC